MVINANTKMTTTVLMVPPVAAEYGRIGQTSAKNGSFISEYRRHLLRTVKWCRRWRWPEGFNKKLTAASRAEVFRKFEIMVSPPRVLLLKPLDSTLTIDAAWCGYGAAAGRTVWPRKRQWGGAPRYLECSEMKVPRNNGIDADGVAETEADHFDKCPGCG
jgi:hypothetical protein